MGVLRASKWTHERIARYLGCDPKTLRNHFSRKLAEAADIIKGLAIKTTMNKAKDGSVSAARRLHDIAEEGRALPPDGAAGARTAPEEKVEPVDADPTKGLGKKEITLLNAQTSGKAWGTLLI